MNEAEPRFILSFALVNGVSRLERADRLVLFLVNALAVWSARALPGMPKFASDGFAISRLIAFLTLRLLMVSGFSLFLDSAASVVSGVRRTWIVSFLFERHLYASHYTNALDILTAATHFFFGRLLTHEKKE